MGKRFRFVYSFFHHFSIQLTTPPLPTNFPPPPHSGGLCMAVQGQENAGTGCVMGTKGKGIPSLQHFHQMLCVLGPWSQQSTQENRLGREIPESVTGGCQLQKSTLMQSVATTELFSIDNISILASWEPLIRAYAVFLPALKPVGATAAPRAGPLLLLFPS